jgi:hypothetical protein
VFHETILNQKIFKEAFNIDLPSETVLTAKLNAKFATKIFQVNGIIKSDVGTLTLSKSYYNRRTKELSSDYRLLIPRLSKLARKQKLRGKLEVIGTFQRKNAKVYLTGKSKNLGGRMVFNLKGNRLNAHMNGVDIEKLLLLFNEKPYATGKLMADIELHDFKKREGTFNFKTKEAKTLDDTFRKALNLNFEESVYFLFDAKGRIGATEINMKAKLDSDILKYTSSNIKYKLSSNALNSTYLLEIPKLSKLNSVTGKRLKGELSIKGELKYEDKMTLTGNTQNLGGNIDFKFKAQQLNAKMDNISVEKLMQVLSYPEVFKAKLIGNFNYDFLRSSGRFTSTLNQAQLLNTYLTQVIKEIRGVNLSNERYAQTYFNATFRKHLVDINFKAQSKTVLLSIPSGQINQANNKINAYYKVKVDNQNLEGKIQGNLSDPEITLNSSKYIQNNMMNMMHNNMGRKESGMMNSMMGGFFD